MKGVAERALIFGVSGQDGSLLARYLLDKGYEVHGTARGPVAPGSNLHRLGIAGRVHVHAAAPSNAAEVAKLIANVTPFEIYHLAGQSSVGLSFSQPREAFESHVASTMNILETVRALSLNCRLFYASSGEIFGERDSLPAANEDTIVAPRTPYGASKAAATMLVKSYRDTFGLHACSGYLFNHESTLRPGNFVAQRIVRGAAAIAAKRADRLFLGNLQISRDWGWAPDYVQCMARMLQQDTPRDYVIATGLATSLQAIVERVFRRCGLDWTAHVTQDQSLLRKNDISVSVGDPGLAAADLDWRARVSMPEIADRLADAALAEARLVD